MEAHRRIEKALERAFAYATSSGEPKKLADAMRYAVFPGGARVRARLCISVAAACGDRNPQAADAAAAAIELLHCASLVHDDMPVFDNSDLRRGKPTVHTVFGAPIALLCGDALIVLAFETIARECATTPHLISPLVSTVARAVGMPNGIVAGQAWESEENIDLAEYHRAKTGALFSGATAAGAIAAQANPQPWLGVGDALGAAYQAADDLRDGCADQAEMGKPAGQDVANNRPSMMREKGEQATLDHLQMLVRKAVQAIPDCEGAGELQKLIMGEAKRLVPARLAENAA